MRVPFITSRVLVALSKNRGNIYFIFLKAIVFLFHALFSLSRVRKYFIQTKSHAQFHLLPTTTLNNMPSLTNTLRTTNADVDCYLGD